MDEFEERKTNHDKSVKNIYLKGYTDPHVTTNEKNNDCHVSILFIRDNDKKIKIINNWHEEEKKIGKDKMINQTGTIMFYISIETEIKEPKKIRNKQRKKKIQAYKKKHEHSKTRQKNKKANRI
jgi:hypothetical protein